MAAADDGVLLPLQRCRRYVILQLPEASLCLFLLVKEVHPCQDQPICGGDHRCLCFGSRSEGFVLVSGFHGASKCHNRQKKNKNKCHLPVGRDNVTSNCK